MQRIILLLCLFLSVCSLAYAEIRVTAQAPAAVAQDETFQVQYTVNSQDISSASLSGDLNGFKKLYGPARSSSYNMQIINGKQSSSSTTTYTYTLQALKMGTYTLPRLSVVVNGKTYTSNAPQTKVMANANANASGNSGAAASQEPALVKSKTDTNISNKDLFIAVTASKGTVYEQEPLLLTYRVYSKVDLRHLNGKMPDLKGFLVKEIPLPQQKQFTVGEFHGENYYTTVWSQYLLFPQQTGKLTVPQIKFEGVVVIPNPNIDLLDAFFNGTSGAIEKEKVIVAPSLEVNVKPLPQKPDDFSGGVGNFSIKAHISNPKIKENETLNLSVVITGSGNVDLVKAPTVQFPEGFDVYDPKTTNNSSLSTENMNGSLEINYLAVPKNKGSYTIPPISFTYFDPQTQSYKTIHTDSLHVDVAKGEHSVYSDKQREILAKSDIRYIKQGDLKLHQKADLLWNTGKYWAYYLVALLLFVVTIWGIRRRRINADDYGRMRATGASRQASKRLKKARSLMKQGQTNQFWEEMLNALSGFVSDKLNIPVSELSKEKMEEELRNALVSEEHLSEFLHLLDDCEFCRYAGGSDNARQMENIYEQGIRIIGMLDANIKRKK